MKDIGEVELVHRRATKVIKQRGGLQYKERLSNFRKEMT